MIEIGVVGGDDYPFFGRRFPTQLTQAEKTLRANRGVKALAKSGAALAPVRLAGRAIATTFWGKAWCESLEGHSDYANRLPRGRSYVRAGTVLHLEIAEGVVSAIVQGSARYDVTVKIAPVTVQRWGAIVAASAGGVESLLALLRGELPDAVVRAITAPRSGLFPEPTEIVLACSCPDWASMCKHVAAVLYGVGARLDAHPELLFRLRRAQPEALVASGVDHAVRGRSVAAAKRLGGDLEAIFGIELEGTAPAPQAPPQKRRKRPSPAVAAPPALRATKPRIWTRAELAKLGVPADVVTIWVRSGLASPIGRTKLLDTPALGPVIAAWTAARARR